ncbi:MAG: hypothetical protein JWQ02_4285, partial [Capsulimonas sp.]|nr:hypothetical protein [Capsulimonas sp.]
LDEIARTNDPLALSSILPLALDREADQASGVSAVVKSFFAMRPSEVRFTCQVKDKAVEVISLLMSSMTVEGIADFDLEFRAAYREAWEIFARPPQTRGETPFSLPPLPSGADRVWLLGAMASDGNGFVREAAARELSQIDSGDELAFLLWRMTDWVAPVRELAVAAVRARLDDARYCLAFAKALPLVRRLEEVRRNDLSDLTAAIHGVLVEENEQTSLVAMLDSERTVVRREACRVLNEVIPAPTMHVVKFISRDKDMIVRQWALRWEPILRTAAPTEAAALRRQFLLDSAPRLRTDALRAEVEINGANAAVDLWKSVTDSSGSVRLCGRYHLRQLQGDADFAARYREFLQRDKNAREGIIAGLGETGTPADFDLLFPYLNGSSRLAQTTLKSLFKLDSERARPVVLRSLIDDRPGMSRMASKLLNRQVFDYESGLLRELWEHRPKEKAAASLAAATLRLSPWLALDVLLFAIGNDSADAVVLDALAQWRPMIDGSHLAMPPQEEVRLRLSNQLQELGHRLPAPLAEWLAASIDNPLDKRIWWPNTNSHAR